MKNIFLLFFAVLPVFAGDVTVVGLPSGSPVTFECSGSVVSMTVGSSPVVFRDFEHYGDGTADLRIGAPSGDGA